MSFFSAAAWVVTGLTGLVTAVKGLVGALRSDHSSGRIASNPVVKELEERAKQADAQRGQIEAEKNRVREQQRLAEERQRRADEERRQAEDRLRHAEELMRRAEEDRLRVEEDRRKAEEARKILEGDIRRLAEAQRIAEEGKREAEARARSADEDRQKAREERKRAEEDMHRAQEEKDQAEKEWRKTEEEKRIIEEAKKNADINAAQARREKESAEREREKANKTLADAQLALEDAERKLREGIRPIITPTSQEIADTKARLQYREGIFHFAVAGISGSGKSSLINALRGLQNRDRGAAPTGVVETTHTITRYADPDPLNPFVWYDVPGAGTHKVPDWVYFNAQGLYIFDCIIVLVDNRFTETDIAILRNCERFQIPAYIARSKSNQHIHNIMESLGGDEDEEDMSNAKRKELYEAARDIYVKETRKSVSANLEAANLKPQRVYLVSNIVLAKVVNGRSAKEMLDELELLHDLLSEARRRRSRPAA